MITEVNHFLFSVTDLEKSIAFFVNVFDWKLLVKGKRTAYIYVNGMWFALNVDEDITRIDIKKSYTHIAFSVQDEDMEKMYEKLIRFGVSILPGRQRDPRDMKSIYFEDPDGHKFEFHSGTLQDRLDYYREAKLHMEFFD